jgi:hypothetical protein
MGVERSIRGRSVLGWQMGSQIGAVVKDAANIEVTLVGDAINQEVTRTANLPYRSVDMGAAVREVIRAGVARNFFPRRAAGTIRFLGDVDHRLDE